MSRAATTTRRLCVVVVTCTFAATMRCVSHRRVLLVPAASASPCFSVASAARSAWQRSRFKVLGHNARAVAVLHDPGRRLTTAASCRGRGVWLLPHRSADRSGQRRVLRKQRIRCVAALSRRDCSCSSSACRNSRAVTRVVDRLLTAAALPWWLAAVQASAACPTCATFPPRRRS